MTDTVRTQAALLALLHPNIQNGMPDATVLQSQTARDLIVSLPTLAGASGLAISLTAPATVSTVESNTIQVISTPDASSTIVRAFVVSLLVRPSAANLNTEHSAVMVFVTHDSGAFNQGIFRGLGSTVVQGAGGSVTEARGLQALLSTTAGTITSGFAYDSSWDVTGTGAITTFTHFRTRQGSGAPGTEYGLLVHGHNMFEKGLVLGNATPPLSTNISLRMQQTIVASAGAAVGLSNVTAFTATANGDTLYGYIAAHAVGTVTFTGLTSYGFALLAPTASGTGVVAVAAQLYMEKPSIATLNAYMSFLAADGGDPTGGGGAAVGGLDIIVAGVAHKLAFY